jgi:uncharacterized protein YukE
MRFQKQLGAMNPNTKLLLEEMRKEFADQKLEMKKAFAEQDAKWESRLSAVESKQDERVDALEHAAKEFESWKPTIESSVQVVKAEVQKLSRHWERAVKEKTDAGLFPSPQFAGTDPQPPPPPPLKSVPQRPSAGGEADGPTGHRVHQWNRDTRYGSVTYTQIPDKGTCTLPSPRSPFPKSYDPGGSCGGNSTGRLPKLNFPEFSGSGYLVARVILTCMK